MMKVFAKFIVLAGLFLCLSTKIFAQGVYVVYDGPEEINQSVNSTEAKIIILSSIKDLKITHSAGEETGIFIGSENGMYRYELNHVFDADDLKDGFCKTNIEVKSSNASSGSIKLTLYPGKCYQMPYNEKLRTLSFQNENKGFSSVYPHSNKALLSFISPIADLTIQVGENIVVNGGKKENVSGIDVNIKKEDSNTNYELVFHTSIEEFNRLPKIIIQDSSHEKLDVPLGEEIVEKGQYKIRISKDTERGKSAQESQVLNISGIVTDKKNSYDFALGIGNGITCGTAGIYSRYRFGKYFGMEAGLGLSDFDNKFMHLSAGVKYYLYKSWALSAHYGNVSVEKTDSYNSENGEFGIDGVKHLTGWSFLAGYDGSLSSMGLLWKMNINTGIGISYTDHVSFAWNIGIGFNF